MRAFAMAVLAWLVAILPSARADEAEQFYRGKVLTLIVGTDAGGGYDAYGRLLARHLGSYLPGNPSIVVQNMPGAGGLLALNHLYGIAARDGTVIAMFPSSNLLDGVLGNDHAKFDPAGYTPIGNMNAEDDNCLVWQGRGVSRTDELFTKDIVTGATGQSSNSYIYPALMNRIIGTRFKLVTGYPGTDRLRLMEKGEIDAICGVFTSTAVSQFADALASDKVRVLIQMGLSRHPAFAQVPTAIERAKSDADRTLLTLAFSPLEIGRPIFAPPGIPPERARLLQRAFAQSMQDKTLIAEAEKAHLELRWFDSERLAAIVNAMVATPPEMKREAKALLSGG